MLNSATQTTSERVDDLPLILHWLQQMEVARLLDQQLRPAHGNRSGLSYGQLSVLFVAYVVTQADHRLNHVEAWVRDHQQTLEQASGWSIGDKDASDDRLADLLSAIGKSEDLCEIEEGMGRHLVRAYALPTEVARCDSSSFSVYHQGEGEETAVPLLHYGYSKDHRPDLRQYRQALGTIDPAGIPLVSATLTGNGDDDSMDYPFWQGLVSAIGHRDFVYLADAKAASFENRAKLHRAGGIYCFPLPMTGQTPQRLQQWVFDPPAQPQSLVLPQQALGESAACEGFELELCQIWQKAPNTHLYRWQERYLVIRSESLAERQQQGLEDRLQRTQTALAKLSAKAATDSCVLKTQAQAILKRHRTEDYFHIHIATEQIVRHSVAGRPSRTHPKPQQIIEQFRLQAHPQPVAIEQARTLCGWRLYVTNAAPQRLHITDAVGYYREQWQLERGFHRFKRGHLPALPIYLQETERIIGLMFLLTIALRLLTLMEFVVHQQLQSQQQALAGLYAGNPKRTTPRPSAEQMLVAFGNITLYCLKDGTVEMTPLSPLQQKILALMRVPPSIYQWGGSG
jgi:transposase